MGITDELLSNFDDGPIHELANSLVNSAEAVFLPLADALASTHNPRDFKVRKGWQENLSEIQAELPELKIIFYRRYFECAFVLTGLDIQDAYYHHYSQKITISTHRGTIQIRNKI